MSTKSVPIASTYASYQIRYFPWLLDDIMDGIPWECGWQGCLHGGRWWRSAYGVVLCRHCQPPAFPSLVVDEGDAGDAPPVDPVCTRVVMAPGGSVSDPRRPLWILRGNGLPERVEAREGRRKVSLPPDATHWCHEGDARWTRIASARPPELSRDRRHTAAPAGGRDDGDLDFTGGDRGATE